MTGRQRERDVKRCFGSSLLHAFYKVIEEPQEVRRHAWQEEEEARQVTAVRWLQQRLEDASRGVKVTSVPLHSLSAGELGTSLEDARRERERERTAASPVHAAQVSRSSWELGSDQRHCAS